MVRFTGPSCLTRQNVSNRDEAGEKLAGAPDGTFLIRESANRPGQYAADVV